MNSGHHIKKLLEPQRVIRDPVHGDVWLTALESKIIDTRAFQHLHQLRQLGLSYLVFPSATHTRFSHSIGTLYSAQKLIDAINADPTNEIHLDFYETFLTRLCALLHDLSNIPFGHTLEDEGNIFPSQWEDNSRVEYFLGRDSEVGAIIRHEANDRCLNHIVQILTSKSNSDIQNPQYAFIADIVGDTFCADLLDYTRRDSYYTGLHISSDPRLIRYISISPYGTPSKRRIALRIGENFDLAKEILYLLRSRLNLMETVVHHPTKLRASAMLICAVYDALKKKKLTKQELYRLGDEGLLIKLEENGTDLSRRLIDRLRIRELHRPIYEESYKGLRTFYMEKNVKFKTEYEAVKETFKIFSIPENRWKMERELESNQNLPQGSAIIYCPKMKDPTKSSKLLITTEKDTAPFNQFIMHLDVLARELSLIRSRYIRLQRMVILTEIGVSSSSSAGKLLRDFMTTRLKWIFPRD